MAFGRLWNWIVHEDPARGASFTSFRFETSKIDECISFIENEISTVSNCSQEDRDYAVFWDDYYDPEVAYKFGETIQQIFKKRDLPALLNLIPNEMINGFRKSKAVNSEFVDIIPQVVIDELLSSSPECSPVGGEVIILVPFGIAVTQLIVQFFSINGTNEKLDYSERGWIFKNKTIKPSCFSSLGIQTIILS